MNDLLPLKPAEVPDFSTLDTERSIVRLARTEDGKLAAFAPFWEQLPQLQANHEHLTFNLDDAQEYAGARSYVHRLRLCKGAVDRVRKAEKAAINEAGNAIQHEAKQLTQILDGMVQDWATRIEAHDRAEQERVDRLQAELERIKAMGRVELMEADLGDVRQWLEALKFLDTSELDEFTEAAEEARLQSIAALEQAIPQLEKRDAERAELAELRELRAKIEREKAQQAAQEAAGAPTPDAPAQGQQALSVDGEAQEDDVAELWMYDALLRFYHHAEETGYPESTAKRMAQELVAMIRSGKTPFQTV